MATISWMNRKIILILLVLLSKYIVPTITIT